MKIENYSLLEKEFVEELNSNIYHLKHNKTGAKVLYIENDDEIKTFGIGFRTPPEDSTGVAHIVEHTVLSGSRKYRTKEPFMDLINSSMQTFLNAMTFPDKTIYPIASRNEKDFFNLMDVYLDAVFYPRIYEVKEIFEQEGWHMELEDIEESLKYNGVVYNEMRGAYSDPDDQVQELLSQRLHPDSTYSHDSGGNPHEIPKLSYENFLSFHKRYYHPSNSYIFLNGKMDIEKVLGYIDKEYLSSFDYQEPNSQIKINKPFDKTLKIEESYSIGKDESPENKSYYAYGVELGKSTNPMDVFMKAILQDILIESDSSILKDKLLESNLAEDYFAQGSSTLFQDLFLVAKGGDGQGLNDFVKIIEDSLKEAIKNGIDKNLIYASLNSFEFSTKDLGIHKGVLLGINALKGWLYDSSPIEALKFKNTLDHIKENLDDKIIEQYIQDHILDNKQKLIMVIKPQQGAFLQKDQDQQKNLDDYKNSLSLEEKQNLVNNTKNLFDYQTKLDSKEDKDTIPKLKLDDISPGVSHLDTKVISENGINCIFTKAFTNDIYYSILSFNLKNLKKEDLPYAGIVLDLLGSLDTKNYSYQDLNNQIDIHTGGIHASVTSYQNIKTDDYEVVGNISGKAAPEKIDKYLELVEEIILKTKFQDIKRIKDLLIMNRADLESNIEQAGNSMIMAEVNSMMSDSTDIANKLGGRKFLFSLRKIIEDLEKNPEEVLNKLAEVYKKIFNNNFTISVAGQEDYYQKTLSWAKKLKDKLTNFKNNFVYERDKISSLALTSSSNVVYVSDGFNFNDYNVTSSGKLSVLARILSGDYLHTQIRAKGGAYGAGISINHKGYVTTYSYRDPNLDKTFEVYDSIADYLDNLELSSEDLSNYIIASMNQFDPPITPAQYASIALARYNTGFDEKMLEKMKKEAIETTVSDIKGYSQMFKAAKGKKFYAVLGSKELIKDSKRKYEKVEEITK